MPVGCCRPDGRTEGAIDEIDILRESTLQQEQLPEDLSKAIQAAVETEVSLQFNALVKRIAALEAQSAETQYTDNCVGNKVVLMEASGTDENLPKYKNSAEIAQRGTLTFAGKTPFRSNSNTSGAEHSLDVGELEDAAKAQCTHPLSESIWEAAIFVNVRATGLGGSACLVVGLGCNMLVQFVFTVVLFSSFLVSELPPVENIWEWRELQGHAWSNMVMATRTSLVRAICEKDRSLITSTSQQQLYLNIGNYLDSKKIGAPLGAMLTSMVLFQWALSIGQELCEIATFVVAVFNLPRSKPSKLHVQADGLIALTCSRCRAMILMSLSLIRLIIAFLLLILGSIWLANTLNIKDLVLNAGALILVLEMDELIFKSLCPATVKVLVRNLKPFDYPIGLEWRGLTINAPMTLFGSVGMVMIMCFAIVLPNIEKMNQINEALCGGLKDFVFDQTPLDVVAVTGTRNPYASSQAKSFSRVAVRDVITLSQPSKSKNVIYLAEYEDFYTVKHSEVEILVEVLTTQIMGTNCEDYGFSEPDSIPSFMSSLSFSFGEDVRSCADLVDHCFGHSRLVRLTCPATCGCNQVHSGLYRNGQNQGCPKQACISSDTYVSQLASIPCVDYNISDLSVMPGWTAFIYQWEAVWVESQPRLADDFRKVSVVFLAYGCGAMRLVPDRIKTMLCYPTSEFGSINAYCPVSCECDKTGSIDCPNSCMWNATWT